MSLFLIFACIVGAVLIVFQGIFEATLSFLKLPYVFIPLLLFFIVSFIYAVHDIKKYGLKLSKPTSRKEQLYAIIDNLKVYHKIIDNNPKIDLIIISETGFITLNLINIEGTIKKLEDGSLYYFKKGGKEGKINNFVLEIDEEINLLKEKLNINNIDKYLIRDKELICENNFAEGFNIKRIGEIFYELEKRKEIVFTKEEIDKIGELLGHGSNKD